MAKVIQATTRAEEYELRAKYLKDEYQLSGDGPKSTEFRINKVLRLVPFSANDVVLDISSGKGLLFEKIHANVTECHGHDVAPAMVARVQEKFKGYPNISFTCGPSSKLPYANAQFDKVLMTGAFCLQETKEECMQTLAEIRRVAKNDAAIFISDICVVDESKLPPEHISLLARIIRRYKHDGPIEFLGSVKRTILRKVRVLLGTEPVVLNAASGIWFSDAEFVEMCRQNRLDAKGFPTQEITGQSKSRYDYSITPI